MIIHPENDIYVSVRERYTQSKIKPIEISRGTGISRPTIYGFIKGQPLRIDTLKMIETFLDTLTEKPAKIYSIERLREYSGFSQTELAEFLGLSQSTLSRLEQSGIAEDSKYYKLYIKLLDHLGDTDFYHFLENCVSDFSAAKLISAIRFSHKMSQIKFSRAIGVSQPFVCQLENNQRNVTIAQLHEYIKKLGLSKEQIFNIVSTLDNK